MLYATCSLQAAVNAQEPAAAVDVPRSASGEAYSTATAQQKAEARRRFVSVLNALARGSPLTSHVQASVYEEVRSEAAWPGVAFKQPLRDKAWRGSTRVNSAAAWGLSPRRSRPARCFHPLPTDWRRATHLQPTVDALSLLEEWLCDPIVGALLPCPRRPVCSIALR